MEKTHIHLKKHRSVNICNRRICNSKQSHLLAWACRLWSPGAGTPDKESNEKWEHSKGFQRVSKVSKKPKRKARIDLKESGFLPKTFEAVSGIVGTVI